MKGLEDLQRFARVRDWRRGKFPRKMIKTGELQQTAGLVIEGALPCASTCSPVWRAAYDPGCAHQCGTKAIACG